MESAFVLDEGEGFLNYLMHTFGCSYICIWFYLPHPSNCLTFLNGVFRNEEEETEKRNQTASPPSLTRRLFDEYAKSAFNIVENNGVPGLAFKNNVSYLEVKESHLQRLASLHTQSQFYQTAIFIGCKHGEIEMGMSNVPQINMEMEMRALLSKHISPQIRPSSSSTSSLRSLSIDSTNHSSFLDNNPYVAPSRDITTHNTTLPRHPEPVQWSPNVTIMTKESEMSPFTRAIHYSILSSSSPYQRTNSAFKKYTSSLTVSQLISKGRQSMMKRVVEYFRNLKQSHMLQGINSSTTQVHHMISERKRRQKLNESFQSLKSLLPPGIKKDKASMLASAAECLRSLNARVSELTRRNEELQARVSRGRESKMADHDFEDSDERLDVRIDNLVESTSEGRSFILRVSVKGECSVLDLSSRVIEFLKGVENVRFVSMEAQSNPIRGSSHHNRLMLSLHVVEGRGWESAFLEGVRMAIDDLAQ